MFHKYVNVHTCIGRRVGAMQGRLLPKMREWTLRLPLEESRKQSLLETICLVRLPRCLQCCSGIEQSVLREAGRKMTARYAPGISRPGGMQSPRLLRLLPFSLSEN